ncbi:hypothetical protein PHSY_003222 [Pseudozyma hubeiensis SY62]|uniref:Uncharacterized protein n=1 Tax=Pseudozyma hubeiensis (strain SY62) TaxID=1305764 RepID=R9P2T1_PSEHS|nr:hypothetical protein PHSY_003222 [Pseudozyma hubeiensis SY62]GAC95646.1 hypothetical protein PHSY_003222 [Pseudozyma hubeiensis SY62]
MIDITADDGTAGRCSLDWALRRRRPRRRLGERHRGGGGPGAWLKVRPLNWRRLASESAQQQKGFLCRAVNSLAVALSQGLCEQKRRQEKQTE